MESVRRDRRNSEWVERGGEGRGVGGKGAGGGRRGGESVERDRRGSEWVWMGQEGFGVCGERQEGGVDACAQSLLSTESLSIEYRVNACAAALFPQSVYMYKDTALCRVEVCAQSLLSME